MSVAIPLCVASVLALVALTLMTRGLPERKSLLAVVVMALLIRWALCIAFDVMPGLRIFHEDADGYELVGSYIAKGWTGDTPPYDFQAGVNYGYFYWCAILSYLFGPYRLHPSLVNSVLSCVVALIVYRIVKERFSERVARRTLLFALFFPSIILWSSIAVKDTAMLFLLVVCMFATLELRKRFSFWHLLAMAGSLILIFTIRFYMLYMGALAIFLSFILFGRNLGRSLVTQVLLAGVLVAGLMFWGLGREAQAEFSSLSLERVATLRSGLASTANSGWRGDIDISSPAKAVAFMPIGILFVLFSPFPWQFTSLRAMLTLPEMLLWWSLTFAWFRGMRYVWRYQRQALGPILIFPVIITIAYSTVHANVGVAFRQRSQIMIFLFVMAALGREIKRLQQEGRPLDALLATPPPPKPPRGPRGLPLPRPGARPIPPRGEARGRQVLARPAREG